MEMEKFNETLKTLESSIETNNQTDNFSSLDCLFKQDQSIRSNTPAQFYLISHNKLKPLLNQIDSNNQDLLKLILKCIKNSAAAFKNDFSSHENQLCSFLHDFLEQHLQNHSDDHSYNFIITAILQYIFNLVQGNQKACELYLNKWIEICFCVLTNLTFEQDIFNLASMILVYSCLEKYDKSTLLDNHSDKITKKVFLNLLNGLDFTNQDFEMEKNWTFKFLNHYFDKFYFDVLITNEVNDLFESVPAPSRLYLLKTLNQKLIGQISSIKYGKQIMDLKYLDESSLKFISEFYIVSSTRLLFLINENELTEISNWFREFKIICNCLCDFLTIEERDTCEMQIRQNVDFIQDKSELFQNTCKLFKEIHTNKSLVDLLEEMRRNSSVNNNEQDLDDWNQKFNIKCDLVRLIGILVYEHPPNQSYLVNDQLLHIISSNLNVDIDNPFVREWSIIALKHILSNLDFK